MGMATQGAVQSELFDVRARMVKMVRGRRWRAWSYKVLTRLFSGFARWTEQYGERRALKWVLGEDPDDHGDIFEAL